MYMAGAFNVLNMACVMRSRKASEFIVQRVMLDFLLVATIRDDTLLSGRISASRQTKHSNRSHQGWRGRPRRSTAKVYSEVATPRREQRTFKQKHLRIHQHVVAPAATQISGKVPYCGCKSTASKISVGIMCLMAVAFTSSSSSAGLPR